MTKQEQNKNNLIFLLGGHDLEMVTIRDLLTEIAPDRFYDKGLLWGAKASDYEDEIRTVIKKGLTPVLIELTIDIDIDAERFIVIDHHGKRAGSDKPTSLHQIFELLNLPQDKWNRWFDLVAANDRGYIPAMIEIGADKDEIKKVRAADRSAQGITPVEEAEGERAAADAEIVADGMLTVVKLSHTRTAAVTDRMEPALGGVGYKNLLIISSCQVNFFGSGKVVSALAKEFPNGWYGGALPEKGFWGHDAPFPDVITFLLSNSLFY